MAAVGATLLVRTDVWFLSKLFGVVLLLYSLYSLFKHRIVLPRSPVILVSGGSIVSFLAGLLGTAGALRATFLNAWNLPKEIYLGTGAAMGLGADLTRVLVYQESGLLDIDLKDVVLLATVALLGTFLGAKVVKYAKQEAFRRIVFVALFLAGLRFLLI